MYPFFFFLNSVLFLIIFFVMKHLPFFHIKHFPSFICSHLPFFSNVAKVFLFFFIKSVQPCFNDFSFHSLSFCKQLFCYCDYFCFLKLCLFLLLSLC